MDFVRKNIGWFLLAILVFGIVVSWGDEDSWIFWLIIPVVLWKLPPFSVSKRVFGWAASKDPLGTKKATAKFMKGKPWYYWVIYTVIIWAVMSALVSLLSGTPTLVLIG